MEINRTRTKENQAPFESSTLTFMISVIHKMVIGLFVLFLSATIYWHYLDQSFPIFSFIKWGVVIAGLATGVILTVILKRE